MKMIYALVLSIFLMAGSALAREPEHNIYDACFKDSVLYIDEYFYERNPEYRPLHFARNDRDYTFCVDGVYHEAFGEIDVGDWIDGIEVDSIEFNRVFSAGVISTVMLPFDFHINCMETVNMYKAIRFADYDNNGKYVIDFAEINQLDSEKGEIKAHTPYLIMKHGVSGTLKFKTKGCYIPEYRQVRLYPNDESRNVVNLDNWEFRGTYKYIKWDEDHPDLGRVYGLAATPVENLNIKAGDFVKVGRGTFIAPMRAYLRYNNTSRARPESSDSGDPNFAAKPEPVAFADVADLPQSIVVRIVEKEDDGEERTTVIGRIDTASGEIIVNDNVWFDMKGRAFDRKPSVKGTYYNNGRKVIIK